MFLEADLSNQTPDQAQSALSPFSTQNSEKSASYWANQELFTVTDANGEEFTVHPYGEQEPAPTGTPTPPSMVAADQDSIVEPIPSVAPTPNADTAEAQETPSPNSMEDHIQRTIDNFMDCNASGEICASNAYALEQTEDVIRILNDSGVIPEVIRTANGPVLRITCNNATIVLHKNGGHTYTPSCDVPQDIPLNLHELDDSALVIVDAVLAFEIWIDAGYDKYPGGASLPAVRGVWDLSEMFPNPATSTPTATATSNPHCEVLATVTPTPVETVPYIPYAPTVQPTATATSTPDMKTVYGPLIVNGSTLSSNPGNPNPCN